MDFDRSYMNNYHMMHHMENCPNMYFNYENMEKGVPPYMSGQYMKKLEGKPGMCCKYMNVCENMQMPYTMRSEYPIGMHHMHQDMEPLENMCGKTYKILIVHVHKTMHKIMMENMGVMPKAISKEKYKQEMNNMMCEVMKNENEIKKIVVVDRNETEEQENTDRAFCPFCNGLLKDTLSILFITELLKGGCTFCY